jgi:long-chain acyl-CoA synthetase
MSPPALTTLEGIIRTHGAARPDAPMGTFDGRTFTYGQVQERSNRVANALLALGVKPDSRVALVAKNGPAFFEVLFGARKVGAVQVAVNWRLSPDEMHYILADADAEIVFAEEPFVEMTVKMRDRLPKVRTIIALDRHDRPVAGAEPYDAWLAAQEATDTDFTSKPDDVALQLYTSGTTGRPKGAMLMNRSVFAFVDNAAKAFGHDPDGLHVNALPLFHVGGINWSLQAYAQGAHVLSFRDFDADVVLSTFDQRKVTHLMTVPAVIQMLLSRPLARTVDFSSLRVVVYGGSTISEKVLKDAIQTFGTGMYGMYGSTELSFGATVLTPEEHVMEGRPDLLLSCGRPLEGSSIRVVDPHTHEDLPEGSTGEIWFRSPQRGLGYWKQPEASAEIFRSDGWYRTGDLGQVKGGYIFLSDRLNDMIISGGENVYPAEVERVLSQHDDVSEVVAFGVPDPQWGEAVHAVVVRRAGASPTVTTDELVSFARDRLARFKIPKVLEFADSLPKTASGKVQREILRAPFWKGRSRRIA